MEHEVRLRETNKVLALIIFDDVFFYERSSTVDELKEIVEFIERNK